MSSSFLPETTRGPFFIAHIEINGCESGRKRKGEITQGTDCVTQAGMFKSLIKVLDHHSDET